MLIKRRHESLIGRQYGRLTVLASDHDRKRVVCKCKCGVIKPFSVQNLRNGSTVSCGCYRRQIHTKHGGCIDKNHRTAEYKAYCGAKGRCTNKNDHAWKWYGARGIKFLFSSFKEFLHEVGPRPNRKYSLERIRNSGHYAPGNVRWATNKEQANNRYCQASYPHVPEDVVAALEDWFAKGKRGDRAQLERLIF